MAVKEPTKKPASRKPASRKPASRKPATKSVAKKPSEAMLKSKSKKAQKKPSRPKGLSQTAKVIENGGSQAIRLPKEFRFSCSKVSIKKKGNQLIITPIDGNQWDAFIEAVNNFPDDIEIVRDQLPVQERGF